MNRELIELQLRQLNRLLDTKRLKFSDAYYVIFSDYPCVKFLEELYYLAPKDSKIKGIIEAQLIKLKV
jgi:hypothetical protein